MNTAILITCATLLAVDGDTVKCDGVNMRPMGDGAPYVSGFDTPEIGGHSHCPAEKHLGLAAKARMAELLETPGLHVMDSGEVDRYGRPLIWLRLPDGRAIGSIMVEEGLARVWTPGYHADWCGR